MTNITIKFSDLFKDEQKEVFNSPYPVRVLYREDENMTVDQCKAIMEGKTKMSFFRLPGGAEASGEFAEGFIAGMLANEPGLSAYVTAQPIGFKFATLNIYSTVKEAMKGLSQTKKASAKRTHTATTAPAMNPPVEKKEEKKEAKTPKAEVSEEVKSETKEEQPAEQVVAEQAPADPVQIVIPVSAEEKPEKAEEKAESQFDRVLAKEAPAAVDFKQAVLGALQTNDDADSFIFTFSIMAGNSAEALAAGKAVVAHFEALKAAADKEPEVELEQ